MIIVVIILSLLIVFSGCHRQKLRRCGVFLFLLLFPVLLFSQTFRKKYNGSIGPYPITITLSCKNGDITGTYYYESFDDPISVRGFVIGKSIEFRGFDLRGNMIDQFVGQVNHHDIQGIWIGEGMQKRYPFKLREDVSAGALPAAPASEVNVIGIVLLALVAASLFVLFKIRRNNQAVNRWIAGLNLRFQSCFAPHKVGFEFEKYMTNKLDPDRYKLLEWRTDKNKKYSLSTYSPNLVFERRNTTDGDSRFAIECKYCNKFINDKVQLGKERLTEKFRQVANKPLFIALGLGGMPSRPAEVYIVPVDRIQNNTINLNEISGFKISGKTLDYDPKHRTLA
jgi:hypothetical protein